MRRRNVEAKIKNNLIKHKRLLSAILAAVLGVTAFLPFVSEAEIVKAEEIVLKNPCIVPDGSMNAGQRVTWDCVWFGSYPQAEVIPSGEYTALAESVRQNGDVIVSDSVYSTLQSASDWDANNDITLNGEKYRRMKRGDATDINNLYQWSNSMDYHYFKYEPIKWRVLHTDGNRALLHSNIALDDQKYHAKPWETSTWETKTVRSWLNGYGAGSNKQSVDYSQKNFIDSAFTDSEQAAIVNSSLENGDENDTMDKIFLLSKSDVYNTDYGFVKNDDTDDEARYRKSSTWAKAMGLGNWGSCTSIDRAWNGYWWLRSRGGYTVKVMFVSHNGRVCVDGSDSINYDSGICPALNLNLSSSNLYTYAGTVCSDGTVEEVEFVDKEKGANGDITVNAPLQGSITTEQLFSEYPEYLSKSPIEYALDMVLEHCEEVNSGRSGWENWLAGYKYMLQDLNSIKSGVQWFGNQFMGTGSAYEKYLDSAVLELLTEICQNSKNLDFALKGVKKEYKWASERKTGGKILEDQGIIELLGKSSNYSKKEILKLIKELDKEWKNIDKIFKSVGYAADFSEVVISIMVLESVQQKVIETLLDEVKRVNPDCGLCKGLERVLEQTKHPHLYVIAKYLEEGILKKMASGAAELGESLVSLAVGIDASGVNFVAKWTLNVISWAIPEASADDVIKAQISTDFFKTMAIAVIRKDIDFMQKKIAHTEFDLEKEIQIYELLYNAKLAAAENARADVEKIAKGYRKNTLCQEKSILSKCSYKEHIAGCKAKVNDMLKAKYSYRQMEGELSVSGMVNTEEKESLLVKAKAERKESIDNSSDTNDKTSNTILTIPDEVQGMKVTAIAEDAFAGNTEIEEIFIPAGIKMIGENAFRDCTALKNVYFEEGLEEVKESAFAGCISLGFIDCPDSLKRIAEGAFDGCRQAVIRAAESSFAKTFSENQNIECEEKEKAVREIKIAQMPVKQFYLTNENFDETGMQLEVSYTDGSTKMVDRGWQSFVPEFTLGETEVCVLYGGKSAKYTIILEGGEVEYEIKCIDENGNEIAESVKQKGNVGEYVTVSAPELEGYELLDDEIQDIFLELYPTPVKFTYCERESDSLVNSGKDTNQGSVDNPNKRANQDLSSDTKKDIKKVCQKISRANIKAVKNKKRKRVKVVLKRTKNITGYQVQYALNKKFKKARSIFTKKYSFVLKKLKLKKTYYIRARGYKAERGKNIYGKWSRIRKVRIKE